MLTFTNPKILARVCKSGCVVLTHHLESITEPFPN